jgi:cytochrome c oxidase subunit II
MLGLIFRNANASTYMPFQGTALSESIDSLYGFLIITSFISFVLLIGGMIWFAVKYKRRTENDSTPNIHGNTALEFLWSFIPFIIFMIVFVWGIIIHKDMRTFPKDSFEIQVTGYQWGWKFDYKSGIQTNGEFAVPVGVPVKLIMKSDEVLHSFFIPAFRIKQDVVPGIYTALWFTARTPGDYQVFCTEYCGTSHSNMLATLKVMAPADFENWLIENSKTKDLPLAERGKLIIEKGTCVSCHNTTSERKIGPGFAGLWGSTREFEDGTKAVADENYIRESILYPAKKIVKGFPNQMNAQTLSETELQAVIEYFKSQSSSSNNKTDSSVN